MGNKNTKAAVPSGKSVNDVPAEQTKQLKKAALENAFRHGNRNDTMPVQPSTPVETQGANYQQTAQVQSVQQTGATAQANTNNKAPQISQQTNQNTQIPTQQTNQNAPHISQQQTSQQQTSYIYDNNTDYSTLISKYANAGNYGQAAILEQQRNAKIDAEGLPYEKTNTYAAWLPGGANYVPGNYIQMTSTTEQNLSDLSPYINQMYDAVDQQIKTNINYEMQSAADQL